MLRRLPAILLLPTLVCLASPAPAQENAAQLPSGVIARWDGGQLSTAAFDRFLGAYAHYQGIGQEALSHLLQVKLVEVEAERAGLSAAPAAVDARIQEARTKLEEANLDLDDLLRKRDLTAAEFRKLIADSLLHEMLVRKELQLGPDQEVTPTMLQEWSDTKLAALLEQSISAPPGMALDVPPYRISEQDLGAVLRRTMAEPELREHVEQLVLQMEMPRWAAGARIALTDDILQREIDWRRVRVQDNPAYGGLTYEEILKSRQSSVEAVLQSDELRTVGYLRLMSEQIYDDAWFAALPAETHAELDNEYGGSRLVSWIFLNATEKAASELDLDFAAAERELLDLRERIGSIEDFHSLATQYSEDELTRRRQGVLGWIHRQEKGVEPEICQAAFEAKGIGVQGPVQVRSAPYGNNLPPGLANARSGMALILVQDLRPAPSEAEFRDLVRRGLHQELRRQYLDGLELQCVFPGTLQ